MNTLLKGSMLLFVVAVASVMMLSTPASAGEKKKFSGTGIFINTSGRQVGYEAVTSRRNDSSRPTVMGKPYSLRPR